MSVFEVLKESLSLLGQVRSEAKTTTAPQHFPAGLLLLPPLSEPRQHNELDRWDEIEVGVEVDTVLGQTCTPPGHSSPLNLRRQSRYIPTPASQVSGFESLDCASLKLEVR